MPPHIARTRAWWGDDVTSFLDGSSTSAPLTGINGMRRARRVPAAPTFAGIALEYGTLSASTRCCRRCVPSTGCTIIREAPAAQRAEIKQCSCATSSTSMPTTGSRWSTTQAHAGCLKAVRRLGRCPRACLNRNLRNWRRRTMRPTQSIATRMLVAMAIAGVSACGAAAGGDVPLRRSGRRRSRWIRIRSTRSLQLTLTGNIYEPLVGRGKKLELIPLLATSWKQTAPTVWRFNAAPQREVPRRLALHRRRRRSSRYERSKVDGSDMKTKVAPIKEIRKVDDLHGRLRHQRSVPDPAGHDQHLVHHEQGVVREEQRHRTGRRAQGQGERRDAARQRHRAVHAQVARARGAHGVRTESELLGKGREQRHRGHFHADQERRDPRRRAHFGRHRHDGAGAAAGHRQAQGRRAISRYCRGRSCARSSSAWISRATSCCSRT